MDFGKGRERDLKEEENNGELEGVREGEGLVSR